MRQGNYNRAVVRQLLEAAFTQGDLVRFLRDRANFQHIANHISPSCSLVETVEIVIMRCEKDLLMPDLLRAVKECNLAQFQRFERQLFPPSKHSKLQTDIWMPLDESKKVISPPREQSLRNTGEFSVLEKLGDVIRQSAEAARSLLPKPQHIVKQTEWALGRGAIHQFVLLSDKEAIAGTQTGTVLLDLGSQQVLWEIEFVPDLVAVAHEHALLALADTKQVVLFDVREEPVYVSSLTLNVRLESMAFVPEKSQMALLFVNDGIELCDVPSWRLVTTLAPPPRSGTSLLLRTRPEAPLPGSKSKITVDPDGRWLAAVRQQHIAVFELKNATCTCSLGADKNRLMCIAFSPDGAATVASGDYAGHVRIHRVANEHIVHDLTKLTIVKPGITALAFSPDGTHLAVGASNWEGTFQDPYKYGRYVLIRLWNLSTGKAWKPIEGHTDFINGVAFIEDGRVLVSAGSDGTVRFTYLTEPESGN